MADFNLNTSRVKKIVLSGAFSALLLGAVSMTGCAKNDPGAQFGGITFDRTDIKVTDKVNMRILVSNPYSHQYEYRYAADRGQIIANNGTSNTAQYYAPFTGGPDTVRVSIYDRTDNINLPTISQQTTVQGESMAYVDLPNTGSQIQDSDNALIKVASVRGSTQKKDIGWGRNPTISPDGRFIAYVSYPGDGSSQIIVRDPVGNETNITNSKSFNVDPAWSPIGSDGNLYLVFASDRISSNSGGVASGTVSGHGQNYHLWRVNANAYDLRQITNTAGNDTQPSWSPDGKSIAFSSDLDNNKSNTFKNIWVLDVQTGKQVQYTHETTPNKGAYNPQWSPDAQKLVYSRKYQYRLTSKLADIQKIWMINFGLNSEGFGQIVTKQYDESIIETFPSWSPDGRSISFVRNRGSENSVVSVEFSGISQNKGYFNEPTQEGDLSNVSEANWARQKSYGYGYNTTPTNPFTPSTTGTTSTYATPVPTR